MVHSTIVVTLVPASDSQLFGGSHEYVAIEVSRAQAMNGSCFVPRVAHYSIVRWFPRMPDITYCCFV